MVDKNSKKVLVIEFLERFDKLCNKVDKNYQEIIKFSGSLEKILKKAEKYKSKHESDWKSELEDFYVQHKLGNKVNFMECRRIFSDHNIKFTLIKNTLISIKNNHCYQCKNKLPLNCYFYFQDEKAIVKWEIGKIKKFSGHSTEKTPLFCSENCFKQSIYYPQPKKTKQNTNRQPKNQPQTTQLKEDYTYCPQCPKKIKDSDKYWYHTEKNDGRKFCSEKCFTNFYGEYCLTCKPYQKYLDIYRLEENDSFGYCWDCYQEQKRKIEELQNEQANAEQKDISSSKLNFDSDKHIKGIVEGMKKALKEKNKKRQLEVINSRERVFPYATDK